MYSIESVWIETILNANKNRLKPKHLQVVSNDEDRGYIPCLVYRNGSDDSFHVVAPDGGIFICKSMIKELLPEREYRNVDEFLEDY